MQLCPNCGEENPDRFRLCGFCGTPLSQGSNAESVRKTVTILFCDLKGSTSLYDRMGDATAYALVRDHFHLLQGLVARSGGGN